MSSANVSIIRTCVHYGRRIISRLGQGSMIFVWAVSASAQTPGTSTSQVCTQDPTYCSDTGAGPSTTTGSGTSSSASSGGSGGASSSGGAGADAPPSIPNAPCGDGFPMDAWGACN